MEQMISKRKKCIEDCDACYKTCMITIQHSLDIDGIHIEPKHLNLLLDCAGICKIAEDFMLRESEHDMYLCAECVDVCEQCAESCEKVGPEDKYVAECAKMCRQCALSCREMAKV